MKGKSLFFEDFSIGQGFESELDEPMTAERIKAFAELTKDKNPIHVDEDFARAAPFGQRIAHGLFGLSMAAGLMHEMGIIAESIMAFRGLEWTFKNPTVIGERIRFKMTVQQLRPVRTGGGLVVFNAEIVGQDGKTLQAGTWKLILRGRPS